VPQHYQGTFSRAFAETEPGRARALAGDAGAALAGARARSSRSASPSSDDVRHRPGRRNCPRGSAAACISTTGTPRWAPAASGLGSFAQRRHVITMREPASRLGARKSRERAIDTNTPLTAPQPSTTCRTRCSSSSADRPRSGPCRLAPTSDVGPLRNQKNQPSSMACAGSSAAHRRKMSRRHMTIACPWAIEDDCRAKSKRQTTRMSARIGAAGARVGAVGIGSTARAGGRNGTGATGVRRADLLAAKGRCRSRRCRGLYSSAPWRSAGGSYRSRSVRIWRALLGIRSGRTSMVDQVRWPPRSFWSRVTEWPRNTFPLVTLVAHAAQLSRQARRLIRPRAVCGWRLDCAAARVVTVSVRRDDIIGGAVRRTGSPGAIRELLGVASSDRARAAAW